MRRVSSPQQRKRQTWLALLASGIEEVGHDQVSTGTLGQSCVEAAGSRRERIAAPGQAWYRTSHGADLRQRQDTDHQRGPADRYHEDGFDGRRRADRVLELSAPRNRY